jgi:hypothetical protein
MNRSQYIHMIRREAREMDVQQYVAHLEQRAAQEAEMAQRYKVQRYETFAAGISCGLLALYILTRRRG